MSLTIFIGETEVDNGDVSVKLVPTVPGLLAQHPTYTYANHWTMSYTAQHYGCQTIPWFSEAVGLETYNETGPKPLELVPAPYGEIPEGWDNFFKWFSFWREFALRNYKNPVIKLG